jgi:hypothetical protein
MRYLECTEESYNTCIEDTTLWDVTQYSLVNIYQHFGGNFCLHLQDGRTSSRRLPQKTIIIVFIVTNVRTSYLMLGCYFAEFLQ